MLSLLVSSASACTCSHHHAAVKAEVSSCHHSEMSEMADRHDAQFENTSFSLTANDNCICSSDQLSSFVAANPISKKFNRTETTTEAKQVGSGVEFQSTSAFAELSPEFVSDLSYSSTLKSLLPARAPPRL